MYTVVEKIANISNSELYEMALAFDNCGNRKSCEGCLCDGVLCGHKEISEVRDLFICEIGKRFAKANIG